MRPVAVKTAGDNDAVCADFLSVLFHTRLQSAAYALAAVGVAHGERDDSYIFPVQLKGKPAHYTYKSDDRAVFLSDKHFVFVRVVNFNNPVVHVGGYVVISQIIANKPYNAHNVLCFHFSYNQFYQSFSLKTSYSE